MRKESNKSLAVLTVCLLSVLTSSCCSKDEFFGIEDTPCIDKQVMYEIALSDLYIDYQKACFSFADELSKIDSTKRGHVEIIGTDTIYENVNFISFENLQILLDSLLKMYPVLMDADQADLKEIQKIALSKNHALREMASMSTVYYNEKTKGYSYTNTAIEWIESLSVEGNPTNGSTYNSIQWYSGHYYTYELIPCVTVGDAMNLAVIWSRNHENAIIGGLGWSDSGLMMFCEQSTEIYTMLIPASSGNPQPLMDFILHPSGSLYPTESDLTWWCSSPEVTTHYIISPNYEFSVW